MCIRDRYQRRVHGEQILRFYKMLGGLSAVKPADQHVEQLTQDVKGHVEQHLNRTFTTFKAHSYVSQVVSGIRYRIKIEVDDGEFVHADVWRKATQELELNSAVGGKAVGDEFE
eukprot:TRINITY_DN497_c0_g1_i6.p1 TRINITY_DN497_c0_g1~~TRINITY_DN497_c0_g1_i6.p1  ORF type:complete len:114 (-),score=36.14 TRINITY_DN497_c0_g1_i6:132-473(-)